ncbi:hypothetical protein GCM10009840_05940 [Pseudolysinimonas kribbensis]|uniref:DUF624 domain-containing protein n=1 Tax=Pseudolysinimonas kribbensis TaxID=433641 RepID=A0ABQ6K3N1_9MICO|nr:hypothetical protein [Pseudolysinimonas kribbensis]GMA94949.1 hypothetical protein GCM10025881_17730 [Pseudolysinimonas kribbensis]
MSHALKGHSESGALPETLRVIWRGLPTLLVGGIVISAASVVAELLAPGVTPVSVLVWSVVVAPCFGALVGQVNDLVHGEEVRAWSFARYLRILGPMSLAAWMVPGASAAIGLLALQWWTLSASPFSLLPLATASVCTVLGVLGAIVSVPLGIADRSLGFTARLLLGLHVAARRPIPIVSVVAFAALGVWAATTWTASIALLVPAPLALLSYAAVWTSAAGIERHAGPSEVAGTGSPTVRRNRTEGDRAWRSN